MPALAAWQQRIEDRLLSLLDAPIHAEQSMQEAFGPLADWRVDVAGWQLWLDPVDRAWWYLDQVHRSWEPVGHRAGEVRFIELDAGLDLAPVTAEDDPARWRRFQAWDDKLARLRAASRAAQVPPAGAHAAPSTPPPPSTTPGPPPPPAPPTPPSLPADGRTVIAYPPAPPPGGAR